METPKDGRAGSRVDINREALDGARSSTQNRSKRGHERLYYFAEPINVQQNEVQHGATKMALQVRTRRPLIYLRTP